ncbi:MAG: hemin receptor [Hydrogenophilaceae bacterium]|nr:hemin receptor [Hydrogenophilaceae bacterium]
MTPQQIQLIQSTWIQVIPIADQAAELFYGKLFELDPAVKPMFRGDMTGQGRKLMKTIGVVVNSLTRLDEIVPTVQDLGRKHVNYGVKPEHYDTVGTALLWTLEQGLGSAFTPPVKEAWAAAYGTLASVMKEAAYAPA